MGWTESPKVRISEIFENRPEKTGRIFFVRGSFRANNGSKRVYAIIAFQKIKNYQKIFIFEKVAKGNVTLANQENPKFPRIWSSFYTSLHGDCLIFCSYPKKSSYTNCVISLYYHIWPGNHNIWFPSGLVTFLSSKIMILEKNHFSAKKSTFQIWST